MQPWVRRIAALALVGAAVGLAVTASRGPHGTAPESTLDVLPVVVGGANSGGVFAFSLPEVTISSGRRIRLARSLRAFAGPPRPEDFARPPEELEVLFTALRYSSLGVGVARSRLLLATRDVRIYGVPLSDGSVCTFLLPSLRAGCSGALRHGALPEIDAPRDGFAGATWGLLSNKAIRVDVVFRAKRFHAILGRNVFYGKLPPGSTLPRKLVVTDRDGGRHVYRVKRCTISNAVVGIDPFSTSICG